MAVAFEAGKGLASMVTSKASVPGWQNKSSALVLFFNNMSKTAVKDHNWQHVSGKALKSISTQPFANKYAGETFLCEADGSFMTGVSGTFQVTVGNSSKFVFFSSPYIGCCKIHFGRTAAEAHDNAEDGHAKDTKVGSLTMYASKQMAGNALGNTSAEGFAIQFR